MRELWNAIVDRPPLTEGWHLVAMLALGVVVVAIIHRHVRKAVANAARTRKP